ncbi:MAG TPA: DsbA family protein [Bryobacteraceae bacterium]|nr:DsbA family protein [Bryobacteraceae bacterium]
MPFSKQKQESISAYIHKLVGAPTSVRVKLDSVVLNERTCFRQLQFVVGDRRSRIALFLSPDERYLVPQVFDSQSDPAEEKRESEQRVRNKIEAYVNSRNAPALGPTDAPVTIAVFADFQCPYCARGLKVLMRDVLPQYKDRVRVAYLQFPLSIHPWARAAAEAMTCVASQSTDLFWQIHDYLFDHQREINAGNLRSRIEEEIGTSAAKGFSDRTFHDCVGSPRAKESVQKDMDFGDSLGISGTPTLFVNGARLDGIGGAEEIRSMIDKALQAE